MWLYHRVMSANNADGMANSVDPDQTALIWDCTVCPNLSVRKLRNITVREMSHLMTKPTKWLCTQQRLRSAWASVQSDQSLRCALKPQWVAKDSSFLHADSEDSDQTRRMPRLIWVIAGRTCRFVGFVMRCLKWSVGVAPFKTKQGFLQSDNQCKPDIYKAGIILESLFDGPMAQQTKRFMGHDLCVIRAIRIGWPKVAIDFHIRFFSRLNLIEEWDVTSIKFYL